MKVLMLGWEFPPFNKGGLGTACLGLTKGLANNNVEVTFVVPKGPKGAKNQHGHVDLVVASNLQYTNLSLPHVHFEEVPTLLTPYITEEEYLKQYLKLAKEGKLSESDNGNDDDIYGKDLFSEVVRYTAKVAVLSTQKNFDIIHAHDWMTYRAGIAAKELSGKPLIVHIHATEFDRSGGNGVNQFVYDIERDGFHAADKVIAVSQRTKDTIVYHYGVDPNKVEVVHNAVELNNAPTKHESKISATDKIVLFLGRITLQKGPDYFVESAAKALKFEPNTTFVVAGSGDMEGRMITRAAELGISHKMLFTGFLKGADIQKAYSMADLYVMPSVSEPFGITPLESITNGTPVLISKQSGVSEVLVNALKVDFWDVDQMTNKMVSCLRHATLREELHHNSLQEVNKMTWDTPAAKCNNIYHEVARRS